MKFGHISLNWSIRKLQIRIDYSSIERNIWSVILLFCWNFTLNTSKTETILFTLRRKRHNIQPNSVNKTQITWTPTDVEVKYLGLFSDTRLNWNINIKKSLSRTYAQLCKLYPLINRHTPLKHDCTTILYKTTYPNEPLPCFDMEQTRQSLTN